MRVLWGRKCKSFNYELTFNVYPFFIKRIKVGFYIVFNFVQKSFDLIEPKLVFIVMAAPSHFKKDSQ